MKPPKTTTAAERELCESILRRMMAELGGVYLNMSIMSDDDIEIYWGNELDSVEGVSAPTLDAAYLLAAYQVEGEGVENIPPF